MDLPAWFPSGAALYNHHECALSQVGTHPDMTLDVAQDVRLQQQITNS